MLRSLVILGLAPLALAGPGHHRPTAVPTGTALWQISAPTNWTGDPSGPIAYLNVATDDAGSVYVANFAGVLVYDGAGALTASIADPTGTVIQYDDVDPTDDGAVWVADSKSHNVFLLDGTGNVLVTIPATTPDNADPALSPNELEVGPDGNVYVMYSAMNTLMQVFAPDGTFLRSFSMPTRALSSGLIDFAFGPDGNLYIVGGFAATVLDANGAVVVEELAPEFVANSNGGMHGVAVDAAGNLYLGASSVAADQSTVAAVYRIGPDGVVTGQFGQAQQRASWGEPFGPGELAFTVALAVMPDGQLVASDLNGAYSQLMRIAMPA